MKDMKKQRNLLAVLLSAPVVVLAIATGARAVWNLLHLPPTSLSPFPCATTSEARRRGTWVCDVSISPDTVNWEGNAIVFKEAWIEEAAAEHYYAVWVPSYQPLGRYYLCFSLEKGERIIQQGGGSPWFVPQGKDSSFMSATLNGGICVHWIELPNRDLSSMKMSLISSWDDPRSRAISLTASTQRRLP
jgi:hypothetical protein